MPEEKRRTEEAAQGNDANFAFVSGEEKGRPSHATRWRQAQVLFLGRVPLTMVFSVGTHQLASRLTRVSTRFSS